MKPDIPDTVSSVVIPMYEWKLLTALLHHAATHAQSCEGWSGGEITLPDWLPQGSQDRAEKAVIQPLAVWYQLLVGLQQIDEHFGRHSYQDFEFAQSLTDFELRKELMVRFYAYNGSPEYASQDTEIGNTYQWIDISTLAWYLAHQIMSQIPVLEAFFAPLLPHELLKRQERSPMKVLPTTLTDQQAWWACDALTLALMISPTFSDADREALEGIIADLLQRHPYDVERYLQLLAHQESATTYEVSFLFKWNVGAEGMWTDVYSGPRLEVVEALLSAALYPILLAHGVQHVIVPPLVNRPLRDLPLGEYSIERNGFASTSYKIWVNLPGEEPYLMGHADLDMLQGEGDKRTQRYLVWPYIVSSSGSWGSVEWNGSQWDTVLSHASNNWRMPKTYPEDQLEMALLDVFANTYQPNIHRLHPTLQEKK